MPELSSFKVILFPEKKTFNTNKLGAKRGSHTVPNKDLHICEYTGSYLKSFTKIHATKCPVKIKCF